MTVISWCTRVKFSLRVRVALIGMLSLYLMLRCIRVPLTARLTVPAPLPPFPCTLSPLSPGHSFVTQRMRGSVRALATAFVVDAKNGLLLTAAHTFLKVTRSLDQQREEWRYHEGCNSDACIILVGNTVVQGACVSTLHATPPPW